MLPAVKAAALLTTVAAVVVVGLWLQSRRRAAEVERSAGLRHRAITRAKAGMGAGHPESIDPPAIRELIRDGADYAAWDAELDDENDQEREPDGVRDDDQ